jgi:hypothetical protein
MVASPSIKTRAVPHYLRSFAETSRQKPLSLYGFQIDTVHSWREKPCWGGCLLPGGLEGCYWWEVWHARVLRYYTQTENIEQLRVACSECTCGCCDNILDEIAVPLWGNLKAVPIWTHESLSSAVCSVVVERMLLGSVVTHREILLMRVYRIHSRDFLLICELYLLFP